MAKGGAAENETCRELSLWWSNGETSALFRRTQMSGGKATVRARKKKKTPYEYGDITFSEPEAKPLIDFLLIENKSGYKDLISILDFIDSPKKHPQLLKWWWKCEKEKEEAGRFYSILIFRRTRKSKCAMISTDLMSLLEDWCGEYESETIDIWSREIELIILPFANLLKWITPKTIKVLIEGVDMLH